MSKVKFETPAARLIQELQTLDIPANVIKQPGWLKKSFRGMLIAKPPCPNLTSFLTDTYKQSEFSGLSVKEWLMFLDEVEDLYPRYRA